MDLTRILCIILFIITVYVTSGVPFFIRLSRSHPTSSLVSFVTKFIPEPSPCCETPPHSVLVTSVSLSIFASLPTYFHILHKSVTTSVLTQLLSLTLVIHRTVPLRSCMLDIDTMLHSQGRVEEGGLSRGGWKGLRWSKRFP